MSRKCLTGLVVGYLPVLVFGLNGPTNAADKPNIIFVITDQQHAGMMSCTGNRWLKTPAMDSLVREGIRFEKAYAVNPVCVPSRIGMATGVMPGRLGVFNNGRILSAVNEAGLDERTLVVFTSDHGNMDAHHRLASKGLFYEASARVPLLMRFKGDIPPGNVDDDHLVSAGLDILPTLCDYAGVTPPDTLLGSSLRPIAQDRRVERWRRYVAAENSWGRMIRSERFKYCAYDSGTMRESLVDMSNDPGEMKNLAALPQYQEELLKHRDYLNRWIEESGDSEAKGLAASITRVSGRP